MITMQPTNHACFICGDDNPVGLHAHYDAAISSPLRASFTGQEHHQGYPGRMHGGIIAALLDETIGRAVMAQDAAVAANAPRELRVRYRQPVPLGVELVAIGRAAAADGRAGVAELLLPDGIVAVEASARYAVDGFGLAGDDDETGSDSARQATVRKQPNSRMCFVCGTRNSAGLKVRFYEQADNDILARFAPTGQHVDDAGDLSLAAIAAMMDEAMGRAIMIPYGEAIWGVTAELSFQIRRPAPAGVELSALGRIISEKSRMFEGRGELLLPDGVVAVTGRGRYVKLDMVALGGFDPEREEWGVRPD
jgi:acyl-coenzyme A thioesterase PaaI-like protein